MEIKPEIDFKNYDIKDNYEGRYKEKYQFFMLGYNIIEKDKLKPNLLLYLFLRRYIRKVKSDKDILGIFEKFYCAQGKLATSWPIKVLARKLHVSTRTVDRWIKELKDVGAIKVENVNYNGRKQNVYVLGKIGEKYEVYYYEKKQDDIDGGL